MDIAEKLNYIASLELPERHSLFQLQHFIINREASHQARMWQCIREVKSRKKTLDSINLEIEEQQDNLELLMLDIEEKNECSDKRQTIALRKLNRKKKQIIEAISELNNKEKNIKEELMFFVVAFTNLYNKEELKNFDEEDVQKEYWDNRMRIELNAKVFSGHGLDPELLKTILSLHDDSDVKKTTLLALEQKRMALEERKGN